MRLKQIKLAGFKSFVDATQVPFPTAMTCVVGPNGCGKSNVIDAVRWVLGESSAKNLRGDAMTDVIFNGSAQRKPVSQASVELVFENTQGRLQGSLADRSEIAVKRVVTRDAQSLYFLNGSKCRRRDITDIFLGTGLGPRSYAIIEQGMISRLIESRPQELRVFIEEAAGISRYKERRKETESRIGHTRDNLERLNDVRAELAKNLDKLKRQAGAAERYKELRSQERSLKAQLTTLKWYRYNQQLEQAQQALQALETEYQRVLSQDTGSLRALTEQKEQLAQLQQQQSTLAQHYYQLGSDIQLLEQQQQHQRSRRQELHSEQQRLQTELQHQLDEQQLAGEQMAEVQATLLAQQPELELLEQQAEAINTQLADSEQAYQDQWQHNEQVQQQEFQLRRQLGECQLNISHFSSQQQKAEQQLQQLTTALASDVPDFAGQLQALADALHQHNTQQGAAQQRIVQAQAQAEQLAAQLLSQQRAQLAFSVQLETATAAAASLRNRLNTVLAARPLLANLTIEPGWETAVAVALQALQWARVEGAGQQDAPVTTDAAVRVDAESAERAGCASAVAGSVDLLTPWPAVVQPDSLAAKVSSGSQGRLVPAYFSTIRCVADVETARRWQRSLGAAESLICPSGDWFGANWQLSAKPQQLDNPHSLQQQLQAITEQISQLQAASQQAEAAVTATTAALQQCQHQLQSEQAALPALQQQLLSLELQQQQCALQQQHQQQQQQQWQQQATRLQAELAELEIALIAAQQHCAELLSAQQQQQQTQQAARQQLEQRQQQVRQWRERGASLQQALQQQRLSQVSLERQLDAARLHSGRISHQTQKLQERLRSLTEQLELLDEPDLAAFEELQALLLSREAVATERQQLEATLQGLQQQIHTLEQGQHGLQQQLQSRQKAMEHLRLDAEGYRVRANNMLELLREQQVQLRDVLPTLSPDADETLWQQQLDNIAAALERLGPVNLAAIDEYQQQAERKNYLDLQDQDLTSALETLETAIKKIDRETRAKFRSTFDFVNAGLQQLFPKVFGGGSAYLELTGEDLLETGVTIMARPPGKKNSTIHLLSGGEKALTALSLVFSIFRLNPAPFCLLDEVDAPLDDANVGRFCNLVREMSDSVQFIYISHNKIAMEMAAQLMGVTMQEPGVSRVVAVDVEDAVKMAQA